ncbi:MAG: hypothetical protein ABJM02_07325 [Paracoccaceae bacterium]
MDKTPSDARRFLLMALGALWLMAFSYAFVAYSNTHFEWKHGVYLGWQGIAGIAAVAIYGVGLAWEKGSAARRLSRLPVIMAILQILAIAAVFIWAFAF